MNKKLLAIAKKQSGYFTSRQAKRSGYSDDHHGYHVKMRHWLRVNRGLYRLYDAPCDFYSECVRWSLWSRNIEEQPQGVISYESALAIYNIVEGDIRNIHLTVPKGFRKRKIPKEGLVLHKENLLLSELETHGAFMTTNLFRTLKDTKEKLEYRKEWREVRGKIVDSGKLSQEQLLQLGIVSNTRSIGTIAGYDLKDEVYCGAQGAQEIFKAMEKQGSWRMSASLFRNRKSQQGGFTLVELLVVIAVISILAGMLLPVLGNAINSAHDISCKNNLRQIYIPLSLYADDYNGVLPNGFAPDEGINNVWQNKLVNLGYWNGGGKVEVTTATTVKRLYACNVCPSAEPNDEGTFGSDYSANYFVMPTKNNSSGFPNGNLYKMAIDTLLLYDGTGIGGYPGSTFTLHRGRVRHNDKSNFLWADGHCDGVFYEDVLLVSYGTTYITPEND